ncbi:MAG: NUDIX hydrolase [Verrucomicrobiota bacterium]
MSHLPPSHWELLKSTHHADCKVYTVYKERFRHPKDGREGDFYTMKCNDWVQVLALTADRELVMVNQYRFGVRTTSWEVPGGVIDDEDPNPIVAGERELVEETGYVGENAQYLGWCHPNPALANNRSHFVLVENCHLREGQNLDPNEEVQVKVVPVEEAIAMAKHGEITHSIGINAIFWLQRVLDGEDFSGVEFEPAVG